MLWVKAFHIIFMVTWFAGLLLCCIRTLGFLPKSEVAGREVNPRPLPLVPRVRPSLTANSPEVLI